MRGTDIRECKDCKWPLPIKKFQLVRGRRNQTCIKCKNIWDRYKITGREFHKMLEHQLFCCVICEQPINERQACIDHCHTSKRVRALLCNHCNIAIGHFKHDKEIAYRAVEYLRNFN